MEPPAVLSASAERVNRALASRGLNQRVIELEASTRTAPEAARSIGCDARQIVKSVVFQGGRSGRPVLVLVSGSHRAEEPWLERYVGEPLGRADAEFVRTHSGFAIGGVPPVAHPEPLATFIDYDLLECPEVWAAAGTPNALCRLTSLELLELTGGRPVPVTPLPFGEPSSGRWVTFDCYGTLVDWRTGLLGSLGRFLDGPSTELRDRLFRTYLAEERRIESGPYRPYREIMVEALLLAAERVGARIARREAEKLPDSISDWPLFPDTRAALRALADREVRVAVLSNIDRDLLDRTLACHDLPVDLRLTAEELRSYKPAPGHWVRFLRETRTDPERVWHVAGAYEYDISTARRLGFRTAFVTRYDPLGSGEAADIVVGDLDAFTHHLAISPQTENPTGTGRP